MGLCRRTRTLCQEGLGSDKPSCGSDISALTQRWDPETCHEPHLCQHHGPPEPEGLLLRAAGQSELPQPQLHPNQPQPCLCPSPEELFGSVLGSQGWAAGDLCMVIFFSSKAKISQVSRSSLKCFSSKAMSPPETKSTLPLLSLLLNLNPAQSPHHEMDRDKSYIILPSFAAATLYWLGLFAALLGKGTDVMNLLNKNYITKLWALPVNF